MFGDGDDGRGGLDTEALSRPSVKEVKHASYMLYIYIEGYCMEGSSELTLVA